MEKQFDLFAWKASKSKAKSILVYWPFSQSWNDFKFSNYRSKWQWHCWWILISISISLVRQQMKLLYHSDVTDPFWFLIASLTPIAVISNFYLIIYLCFWQCGIDFDLFLIWRNLTMFQLLQFILFTFINREGSLKISNALFIGHCVIQLLKGFQI